MADLSICLSVGRSVVRSVGVCRSAWNVRVLLVRCRIRHQLCDDRLQARHYLKHVRLSDVLLLRARVSSRGINECWSHSSPSPSPDCVYWNLDDSSLVYWLTFASFQYDALHCTSLHCQRPKARDQRFVITSFTEGKTSPSEKRACV